jgi:hypothetical protein
MKQLLSMQLRLWLLECQISKLLVLLEKKVAGIILKLLELGLFFQYSVKLTKVS